MGTSLHLSDYNALPGTGHITGLDIDAVSRLAINRDTCSLSFDYSNILQTLGLVIQRTEALLKKIPAEVKRADGFSREASV